MFRSKRPYSRISDLYHVQKDLVAPKFAKKFVPLGADDEVKAFLRRPRRAHHGWEEALEYCFGRRVSWTNLMALQNRGEFHLCSQSQFRKLLPTGDTAIMSNLDVGSGNGSVSGALSPLFGQFVCFDISVLMQRRLKQRQFSVIDKGQFEKLPENSFDFVSLLNVLDVTEVPFSLLRRAIYICRQGVIVAVPLSGFRNGIECGTFHA